MPTIVPSPGKVNNDRVPVRFQYPTEEQALNVENYKKAIESQGEDWINTRFWWDIQ